MNKLKYLVLGFVFSLLVVTPAFASSVWNVKGDYQLNFHCTAGCSGDYLHKMNITSQDFANGNFSGHGYYIAHPSYTWTMTGSVSTATQSNNTSMKMTIVYTGTQKGFTVNLTGIVNPDGSMTGTATSNTGSTFTFSTTKGAAEPRLDYQSQLKENLCGGVGGPIVSVNQDVTGDIDSGFYGNWAYDKYMRNIHIWKTSAPNTYCAIVSYEGGFNAVQGEKSPNDLSIILNGDEKGSMRGGYRTVTFTGNFKLMDPKHWPRYGVVTPIPFNYECDLEGNCPNSVDWTSKYFSGSVSADLSWWGWIYKSGKFGTWVNAYDGSSGNIHPASKPNS